MPAVKNRYRTVYRDFEQLLEHAIALIDAQTGRKPAGERDFYGERIFSKLVCHGLSLKRLSPSPEPKERELWDISSQYAIARTLIETYEALAYIAFDSISDVQREFRLLLWKLHAQERRAEMLRLIGSTHPEVIKIQSDLLGLRQSVLKHPFLGTTGSELRRKVERGETPPYHLTRAERDIGSGVDRDYHTGVIMHLSSHVHTHPFSVHQLFDFKADDPECLSLMSVAVQYSSGFLAKAITGMRDLFAPRVPPMPQHLERLVEIWTNTVAKGVKLAG